VLIMGRISDSGRHHEAGRGLLATVFVLAAFLERLGFVQMLYCIGPYVVHWKYFVSSDDIPVYIKLFIKSKVFPVFN
jgi:hypothetical protein